MRRDPRLALTRSTATRALDFMPLPSAGTRAAS